MKKELTRMFIIKAWLGHYITWDCMWSMFRLRKERIKAARYAEQEARHLEELSEMVNGTTRELLEKNEHMLAIARESMA